jgi:hypothetical protein
MSCGEHQKQGGPSAHGRARKLTGESLTAAVTEAVRERLDRGAKRKGRALRISF